MCDVRGCEAAAVTDRKLHFAVTELCREHASEWDETHSAEARRARREMVRVSL